MLQLKNIKKSYTTGDFIQVALNNVNLNFRRNEFVAILGQSGSGKTTCLNIIGGLDKYDSGDLVVNGKSTKHFKDLEWDAYRNNSIGFIFQSYNLITHLSILDNVEMGMTLSGVNSNIKHKKALEALERVGLKEHVHKKPNQLSGGQMQRVAIARALANDPDIILADEPTGALDTVTSQQIMELIKEIASDKLVIMVTHNPELAGKYSDRIITFRDGGVIDDSNPYNDIKEENNYQLKKTSMSFFTALKLSGKNISTKKWRTALTAFASSIGIIGIALVLSLSTGFQEQIDKFQRDTLSEFPIIITQTASNINIENMEEMREEIRAKLSEYKKYTDAKEVYPHDPEESSILHTNSFTDEYIEYINNIDPSICRSIGFTRIVGMNLLRRTDNGAFPVTISTGMNMGGDNNTPNTSIISSMSGAGLSSYPETLDEAGPTFLEKNYNLLAGEYPSKKTDLVLVIDERNRINHTILDNLGIETKNADSIKFDDIVGTELRLISNDNYYSKTSMGNFMPRSDFDTMYDSENSISLKISGIIRLKEDVTISILGNGIAYGDRLIQSIINVEKDSEIVKAQRDSDLNVITMEKLNEDTKDSFVTYLGGQSTPFMIFLYPNDFESKDAVLDYLNAYNEGQKDEEKIVFTDLASTMTEMTGGIMNAITMVLVAFSAISLVVSLIMIGIITYISVLERTKEIGVLRALGARKKDITRVFNAETFIIGSFSGLLGIAIAYLLTFPTNRIIENATELENVSRLNPVHAIILIAVSVLLTLLGGSIPAKMAAKKDPVEALRTE
ncbi:MAG: ATP-binding cassette domain-containing protein [Tissierellales bacterium]